MTQRQITYLEGEKLLADWRPHIGVFLSKTVLIALITVIVISPVSFKYGVWVWLGATSMMMLLYVFLFDEHLEWFRRRDDVWILTDRRLIFANPDDDATPVSIDLIDILRVKRFLWWTVNVRLANGMTTTMKYLPNSKHVRQSIRAARDNISPPFPR